LELRNLSKEDAELIKEFVGSGKNAKYTCSLQELGMDGVLHFVKKYGKNANQEWKRYLDRNRQTVKRIGVGTLFFVHRIVNVKPTLYSRGLLALHSVSRTERNSKTRTSIHLLRIGAFSKVES